MTNSCRDQKQTHRVNWPLAITVYEIVLCDTANHVIPQCSAAITWILHNLRVWRLLFPTRRANRIDVTANMPPPDADTQVKASSEGKSCQMPSLWSANSHKRIFTSSRRNVRQPLLPSHQQSVAVAPFLYKLFAKILNRGRHLHQWLRRCHTCGLLCVARCTRARCSLRDRVSGCACHQSFVAVWRTRQHP